MSSSSENNNPKKCERCQTEDVAVICQTCQPFHNFCLRCDSIIHSMKLKTTHVRETILNIPNQKNRPSTSTNNIKTSRNLYSNGNRICCNSAKQIKSLTPDRCHTYNENNFNNNSFNNGLSIRGISNINTKSNNNNCFTKEYVDEINRINEKEKAALKYKLESLQSNMDRLKNNFQNEMNNLQNQVNENYMAKKMIEEKMHQLIEVTLKEKDTKINLITKENNLLKEKTKILEDKIKEKENIINQKNIDHNIQIKNLKNEIDSVKKDNSFIQKRHNDKVSEIVRSNNNNLKNMTERHQKEIQDIYKNSKSKNDQLIQQIQSDLDTIDMLKNKNNNCQQTIEKMKKENHYLLHENIELKKNIDKINNNLNSANNVIDDLKKNIQNLNVENEHLKNDLDYFENTINELKNEIILLNEAYAKKDKDFNYLLVQSEKIRKNFSVNMFNNEELDSKNKELEKENFELKQTIASYNKSIMC